MSSSIRGIESRHEQNQQKLIRDTRTLGQKFWDGITSPQVAALTLGIMGAVAYVLPGVADIMLVLGVTTFTVNFMYKATLPFRLPMRSKLKDYNDPLPGSNKPREARGISFIGNDRATNEELWLNNDDMRTHMLIFGSTGSGKTEALVSIAYNALLQGSGFIYVDGKGDNSLFAKIYSMTRSMGREDDLLLVNFMTGARDIIGPQKSRLSNTMNPFANGSSSMLAQLVIGLMDKSAGSPDGDMWKGRAITFVEALMRNLTYMRDQGHILLDANTIRKYFALNKLESIALDKKFPLDDGRVIDISDAPPVALEPLDNYLLTLPGFNPANKGKQSGEVWEQHGFITMQLTRVFTSLADTYGHIIRTNLSEVDFKDVVLNRRILVVLLPALEKAPAELANLGKIIVASLKAMMAAGLGDQVEGSYRDVIERKPTTSPTPYMCILDEYGYYAVEGFAVVPAQARSLGFSTIFAGQDLPAFQKASKEEAASIGANTNIKICMKLEDPTETLDFFVKTAGEAYVTTTGGFQTKAGQSVISNNYLDTQSAQVEKRHRIELLDLKDQREGEAHIFFKSKIIRAKMFFANPQPTKNLRVNQLLKVDIPNDEDLIMLANRIAEFTKLFEDPKLLVPEIEADEDLQFLLAAYSKQQNSNDTLNALNTLVEFYRRQKSLESIIDESMPNVEPPADGMNIFEVSELRADHVSEPILEDPATPMLNINELRKGLASIEHICGKNKAESLEISDALLRELSSATTYPPANRARLEKQEIINSLNELTNYANSLKNEDSNGGDDGGADSNNWNANYDHNLLDDLDDLI